MRDIFIPRRVLLVEIERRCSDAACDQKARIGLTKEEAREYLGFKCERCERWTPDNLTERDVPDEWWQEFVLTLTSSGETRSTLPKNISTTSEAPEAVTRLSDAYRRKGRSSAEGDES